MVSLEYNCSDNPKFGETVFRKVRDDFNILISSKWHRISLSPPYIINREEVAAVIAAIADVFIKTSENFQIHTRSKHFRKNKQIYLYMFLADVRSDERTL